MEMNISRMKDIFKPILYSVLLSLAFILISVKIAAQSDKNDFKFENISIKDGLSQSSPNCIFQDSRGLLWIGTEDGLNKYDGYQFLVYKPDPNDAHSISHSRILVVYEDKASDLWIGTNGGGLNKFERNTERFYRYQPTDGDTASLAGTVVKCIKQLDSDELWIGTESGLSLFDETEDHFIDIENEKRNLLPLLFSEINSFAEDSSGNIWIGTLSGLFHYSVQRDELVHYRHDPLDNRTLMDDAIQCILLDHANNLWIGTESGLAKLESGSDVFVNLNPALTSISNQVSNPIKALFEDEYGHIWIGTFGSGLYIYFPENEQFIHYNYNYNNPYSLSNNEILSIYGDHSGIIWVGSNGLDKYNPKKEKFRLYDYVPYTDNNLVFRNIHPIYEDASGVLWIGSKGDGVHILDRSNKTYAHLLAETDNLNSLPSNRIRAILENPAGVLWIGTDDQGLCKLYLDENRKPVRFVHFKNNPSDPNSVSSNTIYDLFFDESENLWIGTSNGLTIMDTQTETFIRYTPEEGNPNSLSHTTAYGIYADKSSDIWIATDYGINKFDPLTNGFIRFIHDVNDTNSIIHNEILTFHEDANGFLWVGTYGYGIDRFDTGTNAFKHYSHISELSKAVVYGILEDDENNLWLSTNNGIIKFNPVTEQVKVFSIEDGLQSNEFNGTSYYKSHSGEMFFGGQYGFNSFYPEEVIIDSITPGIVLSDLQVNNISVAPGEDSPIANYISEVNEIILSHRENNFTLYFSALHYANPAHNQYKYMLDGFDDNWIDAGIKRFVTYTNLPYKSYTFKVIAANSDGVWNEEGLSVRIKVKPPFWSTLWFRLLVIALIATTAFYLYRWRIQFDEKQKQILKDKFEESNQELQKAKEQLEKQHEEIIIQKQELRLRERDQQELLWFNQGISTFSEIISRKKHDLKELCKAVINKLIEYVEAQQGGIFLINDEDENDPYLELVAYNAFQDQKINQQFKPGEGYIGACYNEKQFIEVDNLSDDYSILHSGLGAEILRHLVVAPLNVGDTCIGVIEICSFKKLKGYKLSFIEKLIETLASTINTERANRKMKMIIEDSKNQAQELQDRENQLRMQLEENMATQEEVSRREKEYHAAIEAAKKLAEKQNKQIEELKSKIRIFQDHLKSANGKSV